MGFIEETLGIYSMTEGIQGTELIESGRIHCAAHSKSKFEVSGLSLTRCTPS